MLPPLLKHIRADLREFFGLTSNTMWRGKDVLLIVGQNGAGKSMVRRMLKTGAGERKIATYDFSQERRCEGGVMGAMIYGSEHWESTGYISIKTFRTAFKQDPDVSEYMFIWDEPEIGLSEESQLGIIQFVREQFAKDRDERLLGCVFMTHSRLFVRGFMDYPKMAFIDLDGKYATAAEWADREAVAADLDEVCDRGIARFRELSKMLNKKH